MHAIVSCLVDRALTSDDKLAVMTRAARMLASSADFASTLEQTILAAAAWAGLALTLPAGRLGLIGPLAILFVVGRAAFFAGYLAAPWARAFGFGLTFYPTGAALVWLAFQPWPGLG